MTRKPRHYRAHWRGFSIGQMRRWSVQVWSFSARDMAEAKQIIRDVVLTVAHVQVVEIESDDGTERAEVSR